MTEPVQHINIFKLIDWSKVLAAIMIGTVSSAVSMYVTLAIVKSQLQTIATTQTAILTKMESVEAVKIDVSALKQSTQFLKEDQAEIRADLRDLLRKH